MKRITVALAALALAAAPTALAKGPSHAEITGPGLDRPIVFDGFAESGGIPFSRFVEGVGWFPAVFGQQPSPLLAGRPRGSLGPAYTIRYRVPTGGPRPTTIVQILYPFAAGGPVVYTRPGQPLFGTRAGGGWFRAAAFVKPMLVKRGLPVSPPASTGSGGVSWLVWLGIGVLGAVAAVALASRLRRRPAPSPA
jgi:hypothetical protein